MSARAVPSLFAKSRENLINGNLNLGADNGKELTFPVEQVAIIDFVGGRPQRAEPKALPSLSRKAIASPSVPKCEIQVGGRSDRGTRWQ